MVPQETKPLEKSQAPNKPETRFRLAIDFKDLSEEALFELIATDFLQLEEKRYRNGLILPAESKLLYLVGPLINDGLPVTTSTGIEIYTKKTEKRIRQPEIDEAIEAINKYLHEDNSEQSFSSVLSELADVWYNLIQFAKLDKAFAQSTQACIDAMCKVMPCRRQDAYLLVIAKYKTRVIENEGVKNLRGEEDFIGDLTKGGHDGEVKTLLKPYNLEEMKELLQTMKTTVLIPRLQQRNTFDLWWRRNNSPDLFETRPPGQNTQDIERIETAMATRRYAFKSTIRLLEEFKRSLQPEAVRMVNLRGMLDVSVSEVFPKGVIYVNEYRYMASELAALGYESHFNEHESMFQTKDSIDICFDLRGVAFYQAFDMLAEGGYLLTPEWRSSFKNGVFIGMLEFDEKSGEPAFVREFTPSNDSRRTNNNRGERYFVYRKTERVE